MLKTVTCNSCGSPVDPSLDTPAGRSPCRKCGSTTRNISATLTSTFNVSASLTATLHSAADSVAPKILLKSLITPGDKSKEGQLIEAVALPWVEIIKLLEKDPSAAFQIPARKWEEIIAGAYVRAGFDEVILTPHSADLGRDVIAIKRGLGEVRVIDQVKAYKPGHLVTANDVRAIMGVLQNDGAAKGFLTTTSDFAPTLHTDPLISPWIPSRLGLINGMDLFSRLQELAKKK